MNCPICNGVAIRKGPLQESVCEMGHWWHKCREHGKIVPHSAGLSCTCSNMSSAEELAAALYAEQSKTTEDTRTWDQLPTDYKQRLIAVASMMKNRIISEVANYLRLTDTRIYINFQEKHILNIVAIELEKCHDRAS